MTAGDRYLGAYALCVDEAAQRLLMARLRVAGGGAAEWTLPGGGVEWGEHPRDAAVRELAEETGLRGEVGAVAAVFSHLFESDGVHMVGLVYEASAWEGELRHEAHGSTDRCAWLTLAQAAALPMTPLGALGVSLATARLGVPDVTTQPGVGTYPG